VSSRGSCILVAMDITMEEPVILKDLLERTKQALELTSDIAQRKNLERVIKEIRNRAKRGYHLKDGFQRAHALSNRTPFEVCMIGITQELIFAGDILPDTADLQDRLGRILADLERTVAGGQGADG